MGLWEKMMIGWERSRRINGWMDGWLDGWMDRWVLRKKDG